jgi:ABC-2 type transport system permease protein
MALGYARGIVSKMAVETTVALLAEPGAALPAGLPVTAETRLWYNPELRSSHFIVPALIAVILMMASALLTSVTIVREKETGTLEQLLVSPVRSGELIAGKVLPYGLLALLDGAFILISGALVFGVPMRGSVAVLLFYTTLYIMAALAIGLFISTLFSEQRVATFGALVVTVLPAFMLSDFIFPVRSMPVVLQLVSRAVPATYYIPIVRGVLLKGSGASLFFTNGAFMAGFMLVLLAASVLRFKPRLE